MDDFFSSSRPGSLVDARFRFFENLHVSPPMFNWFSKNLNVQWLKFRGFSKNRNSTTSTGKDHHPGRNPGRDHRVLPGLLVPARAVAQESFSMNTRDPGADVLDCRRCGAQITAEDINPATALARCRHCHAVFELADHLSGEPPTPPPMNMPLPKGITISERGGILQLVRRWFGLSRLFQLLFCIALDTFLVFWYMEGAPQPDGEPLAFVLPSIYVGLGVVVNYMTIAGLLNRTIIEAGATHLASRHTPVPWRGNLEIPVSEQQQLFCEEHVRKVKHGSTSTYSLNAVLENGRKLSLLKDLPEPKQALFLEYALEKHLGIVNRPVPGELRR